MRASAWIGVVLGVALACASSKVPAPRGAGQADGAEWEAGVFEVGSAGAGNESLEALARIFYSRVANRRFSSISTYYDPALREFFSSPEAFSDYFADFVDALTAARFQAERPTTAVVEAIEVEEPGRVRVTVRFEGDNAVPLRWWKARLVRQDWWERSEDRWWIIPGKL